MREDMSLSEARSGVMTKDLVIYSTQRSGTHFLASMLSSGTRVASLGEVLARAGTRNNFFRYVDAECARAEFPGILLDADGVQNLFESFMKIVDIDGHPECLSMVFMYNQVEKLPRAALVRLLADRAVIHLIRRNVLRTHVSDLINKSRLKPAHSQDRAIGEKPVKIQLPVEGLVEVLQKRASEIRHQRKFISQFDHVELYYEDLSKDSALLGDLLARFGLAGSGFSTTLARSNPQPLCEILENFDTVQKTLAGTEFLQMSQA